jgi:hypothetical protein
MLFFMYTMPRGVVGTLGPWLMRFFATRKTAAPFAARRSEGA